VPPGDNLSLSVSRGNAVISGCTMLYGDGYNDDAKALQRAVNAASSSSA
jgi:hypothetical protein